MSVFYNRGPCAQPKIKSSALMEEGKVGMGEQAPSDLCQAGAACLHRVLGHFYSFT